MTCVRIDCHMMTQLWVGWSHDIQPCVGNCMEHRTDKGSRETLSVGRCSLIPRPSMPPVFDRLQYAKTEEEGRLLRGGMTTWQLCRWSRDEIPQEGDCCTDQALQMTGHPLGAIAINAHHHGSWFSFELWWT